jgi:hypothetical protein
MSEQEFIIAIVAIGCTIGGPMLCILVAILCQFTTRVMRVISDANLKSRLVQFGYSAADIERILAAESSATWKPVTVRTASPQVVTAQPIKATA